MKATLALVSTLFTLGLAGCADPLEQTTGQDVKGQFQRGFSGQGHLTPSESVNNPTAKPAGVPSASEPPPEYPPP